MIRTRISLSLIPVKRTKAAKAMKANANIVLNQT